MTDRIIPVVLKVQGDRQSRGEARVHELTDYERWGRALRPAVLVGGLGLLAVGLPLIHAFFVPFLLTLSVVVLAIGLWHGKVVTGGGGTCPGCGQHAELEAGPPSWPLEQACPHCYRRLVVEPVDTEN